MIDMSSPLRLMLLQLPKAPVRLLLDIVSYSFQAVSAVSEVATSSVVYSVAQRDAGTRLPVTHLMFGAISVNCFQVLSHDKSEGTPLEGASWLISMKAFSLRRSQIDDRIRTLGLGLCDGKAANIIGLSSDS